MQKNIDFGTFPDDPSADPIRTAFQKTQENFAELFQNQTNTGVSSINRNPGAGITVNRPTGDVILSANIACVKVYSSSLSVTLLGSPSVEPPSNASITQSSQTMVIDLPANISGINNISVTGNLTGTYIIGNGAFLTGLTANANASQILNGNSNVVVQANSNVLVSVAGNSNTVTFTGTGILLGNGTGGSFSGANVVSANYFVGNGSLLTDLPTVSNITTIVPNIIWDSAKSLMLFKAPNENIYNLGNVSTSPVSVDWTDYNNYYATLETNTTFEFAGIQQYDNLNPISMIASVTLYLKQDSVGNRTITWPIEVKWPENTIPISSVTANAIDIYTFLTYDGGNTIIGLQQVKGIV